MDQWQTKSPRTFFGHSTQEVRGVLLSFRLGVMKKLPFPKSLEG